MRYLVLVNPVAGKTNAAQELRAKLIDAAAALGIDSENISLKVTQHPGHARELAAAAAAKGEEIRIYAAGGDGTFNEAVSGAYPYRNAAVGCLPYGSGNDFIRSYGLRGDFMDMADQLSGVETEIDLIETDTGVCVDICSAGLDAQVAHGVPKLRRLPLCGGELAYRLSILQQLCGKIGRRMEFTLDGQVFTENCLMLAVCNGNYYGGGFCAAPEARMDDGLMDIIIVRKINLVRIAKILGIYQKGGHMKNGHVIDSLSDAILFCRAKQVSVHAVDSTKPICVNVDGETGPRNGLNAKILPLAGRIILPKKLAPKQTQAGIV